MCPFLVEAVQLIMPSHTYAHPNHINHYKITYYSNQPYPYRYGQIPTSVSTGLTSLKIMNLNSNRLQGAMDLTFFQQLTKLVAVNVFNNHLVGFVPDSLGSATDLMMLYMDRNKLSGYVSAHPQAIPNLKKLAVLQLDDNLLTGSLEFLDKFTADTYLADGGYVYLNNNSFTGEVNACDIVGNASALDVQHNDLSCYNRCWGAASLPHKGPPANPGKYTVHNL